MANREPVRALPEDYHEVRHVVATSASAQIWLNLAALIPLVLGLLLMTYWSAFVMQSRGARPGDEPNSLLMTLLILLVVFPLHEWLHGLAIQWVGHQPRYGAKYAEMGIIKIPIVFYATTDDGLFRRSEFVIVALAPLVGITLLGLILTLILPDSLHYHVSLFVALNAAGAIGDLWMTGIVLRYPATALVRDEADSIRVFVDKG